MKYGLVRLQNWQKLPVETHLLHKILCWFVLVGWAIYPLGYMLGTDGWYTGLVGKGSVDAVYNIADAINKIGFGLVIYTLAVKSQTN
jgi:bacteriorhodopsin